ncbi:hypothetical protein P5664_21645 [Bacillus subtilis]|nr:hypothetical protein P5659_03940 [Bacillus subtilis]WGE03192.1 hypothetical protein P5651_02540 [Bacillus subtilis]
METENNSTKNVVKFATAAMASVMFPVGPTLEIIKYFDERAEKISDKSKNLNELEEQVLRKELANRISEAEAKAFQELAIANRIAQAHEVEIEEYYDTQGDGAAGVQYKESNLNIGASGSGRKISKRVYRFKGFQESELQSDELQSEEKQQTEE